MENAFQLHIASIAKCKDCQFYALCLNITQKKYQKVSLLLYSENFRIILKKCNKIEIYRSGVANVNMILMLVT